MLGAYTELGDWVYSTIGNTSCACCLMGTFNSVSNIVYYFSPSGVAVRSRSQQPRLVEILCQVDDSTVEGQQKKLPICAFVSRTPFSPCLVSHRVRARKAVQYYRGYRSSTQWSVSKKPPICACRLSGTEIFGYFQTGLAFAQLLDHDAAFAQNNVCVCVSQNAYHQGISEEMRGEERQREREERGEKESEERERALQAYNTLNPTQRESPTSLVTP